MQAHRCRFVDWVPSSITAVAFDDSKCRLAVARTNGDIEIWNVGKKWYMQYRVTGVNEASIKVLVWCKTESSGQTIENLYAAGLNGVLFQVDLLELKITNSVTSGGGAVWSLIKHPTEPIFAVGCEDGGVRLFSVNNSEGSIELIRLVGRSDARVLSVAFSVDGSKLYAGGSDGIIRSWEEVEGGGGWRSTFRITIENFGGSPTLVWCLKVLSNGTVISGDSLGHVQFWDPITSTLIQGFNQHDADIMVLAVNEEEDKVFASGVDSKVTMLQKVPTTNGEGNKWVYSYSHRGHTHDVKAFDIGKVKDGKQYLVSGGDDTQLVLYNVDSFNSSRVVKLSPFPRYNVISLATSSSSTSVAPVNLMLVQNASSVDLWRLGVSSLAGREGDLAKIPTGNKLEVLKSPQKLVSMKINNGSNLSLSLISPDAKFIVVADSLELRIFTLNHELGYSPSKIDLPPSLSSLIVHHAVFIPNSMNKLIVAVDDGSIIVINIEKLSIEGKLKNKNYDEDEDDEDESMEDESSPCVKLAVSPDGQWVASGNANNIITIYSIDKMNKHSVVPRFPTGFTALSFHETGNLVVVTDDNKFYIHDTERNEMTDWTKEFLEDIPTNLCKKKDVIEGVIFNKAEPNAIYLYSRKWICHVDIGKPIGEFTPYYKDNKRQKKRAKLSSEAEKKDTSIDSNFKFIDRFQPLFYCNFLKENELLTIELPWLNVIQHFPDVLDRHRYAT